MNISQSWRQGVIIWFVCIVISPYLAAREFLKEECPRPQLWFIFLPIFDFALAYAAVLTGLGKRGHGFSFSDPVFLTIVALYIIAGAINTRIMAK